MLMDKENLDRLADLALGTAKIIIEGGDEVHSLFLLVNPVGEVTLLPAPFTQESKATVFGAMRRVLQLSGVPAYCWISEAWTKWFDLQKGEEWDGRQPSEYPDKIDVVSIDAWTRDGLHVTLVAEVKTLVDGSRRVEEPRRMGGEVQAIGLCTNLFNPPVQPTSNGQTKH